MRILLDTHLLLWALASPSKLTKTARRMIETEEVFASVASIWEIAIKASLGKLVADPSEILAAVEPAGFALLSIRGEHAAQVAQLPMHHRDPFDRLLVSQARIEPMRLLSNDEQLLAYGDFVVII